MALKNRRQGASTQADDGQGGDISYQVKRLVVTEGQVLELIRKYGSPEERREAGLATKPESPAAPTGRRAPTCRTSCHASSEDASADGS